MRRRATFAALVFAAVLLTACGGSSPTISGDAASQLHEQVTAVRDAVDVRDADGAARALATLQASVERLRRSGDITDERAAEIVAAAGAVQTQLVSITTTTTTTTTPPPTPAPKHGKGADKQNQGEH